MHPGMSRIRSYTLGFVAVAALTVGIGWLGKSMIEDDLNGALEFWHAGYYRDNDLNRLFTIAFLPSVSRADVKRYAGQLTHTPGYTTVAFFYPEGSRIPSTDVTRAQNLADAKQALRTMTGASSWRYAARKDEDGNLELVDCEDTANHRLCRH